MSTRATRPLAFVPAYALNAYGPCAVSAGLRQNSHAIVSRHRQQLVYHCLPDPSYDTRFIATVKDAYQVEGLRGFWRGMYKVRLALLGH